MKRHLTIPLALSLAAAPLWCAHASVQEGVALPEPSATPHVEIKVHSADSGDDADSSTRVLVSEDDGSSRVLVRDKDGGKKQKVTFLGVNTVPLPDAVAAQLPIEKGTGLLVTFVAKDSPAEKAGLAPNDVLVKLDEHILVNTPQLQTVIENRKEGDAAVLVFYRKGQEKTASATLASQEKAAGRRSMNGGDRGDAGRTAEFEAALARAQAAAELGRQGAEFGKQAAELGRQAAERGKQEAESFRQEIEKQKGDWAMSMSSLKKALAGIDLPSDGLTTTFSKPGSAQALTLDREGIFLLTRKENTLHLRATDKSGNVRFDGDVTTPEEQAKVPSEMSAKLQKLLKDFPSETAPPAPPAPPRPAAPALPAPPAPPGA